MTGTAEASLPAERAGAGPPEELIAARAGLAQAVAAGLFRTDPAPEAIMLGEVPALRFRPASAARATLLHFHGGAFRIGCPEQSGPFAAALAERAAVDVVCPRYRLAPEHPFPAALNDARTALAALHDTDRKRIIISGDSAGGGLAAGLAAVAGEGPVRPIGLILLSAWLDLRVVHPSYRTNADRDPLFSEGAARTAAAFYLAGRDADHPLASPGLGRVDHFPPTLINVGIGEALEDDSRALHAKLQEAGVDARLQAVPDMEHVAVTRGPDLPGSKATFDAIIAFINHTLAQV